MSRADSKARAIIRRDRLNSISAKYSRENARNQDLDHLKAEISNLLYELRKRDFPYIQPVKVEYGAFTITRGGWCVAHELRGGRGGEYTVPVYLLANGSIIRDRTKGKIRYLGDNLISNILDGVRNLRAEL